MRPACARVIQIWKPSPTDSELSAPSVPDWDHWQPQVEATLLFLQRPGEVLLIEKKTGFGQGKVNGPGGKIEQGETPEQAAIREVEEEICVTPVAPSLRGLLRFQFRDGLAIRCRVYVAAQWIGQPCETEDAKPFWCAIDQIPYDRMWEDDRHWLPCLLEGKTIDGRFGFDGDRMTSKDLRVE